MSATRIRYHVNAPRASVYRALLKRQCGKELCYAVRAFSSAEEFLRSGRVAQTKGLILDIWMPGMSGPDLQRELRRPRWDIPIIYITARTDETSATKICSDNAIGVLSEW